MITLTCKICGKNLLTEKDEKRYKLGYIIDSEGCVINPKIINGKEYRRNKCYDCFESKYGRKPKRLNVVGYDMCYLMDLPEEEVKIYRNENNNVTEKRMKERYGEEEGLKRWNLYRQRQAYTNSYEYKKEKLNWTEEEFKKYNNSRAITLETCISRHGQELGAIKYKEYCEKQSYAGCKEDYFIGKYGKEKGSEKYKEINSKKALTISNFIRKYGKEDGTKKFNEWLDREVMCYSNIANELFQGLLKHLTDYKVYFYGHNNEYGVWLHSLDSYAKLDFYVLEFNKGIEFFGDYWHCNENKYSEDFYHTLAKKTAKEIRERDNKRIQCIKQDRDIDVLIIWESDYNKDKVGTIKKCLDFLGVIYD